MIKTTFLILLSLSLVGCFLLDEKPKPTKESALGERHIRYYADKTVTDLEVPPDLTKPDSKYALRLSDYVEDIQENTIDFFADDEIYNEKQNVASVVSDVTDVQIKRIGQVRWLVVDKKPEVVWNLARNFFKSHSFTIKKTDKQIGIMETDFLQNYPDIPDQSLGLIRSFLKNSIKARYTLPIVDRYKVRIESIENGNKTEVYFTLDSMEEVATKKGSEDENTIWQARPKDYSLETEMLYRFMLYLGSDRASAKEQIISDRKQKNIKVTLMEGVGGYAKLRFPLGKYETWESVGWALDELNINVEDEDIKESSFYINAVEDQDDSIISRMFSDPVKQSYQIIVKQIDSNTSEVIFSDLSEHNEQLTIDFSHKLLGDIAKKFQ